MTETQHQSPKQHDNRKRRQHPINGRQGGGPSVHGSRNHQKRRRRHAPPQGAPSDKPSCWVCQLSDKPPAYKCPKCRALYCSVTCCKEHKTRCPGAPPQAETMSRTENGQSGGVWNVGLLDLPAPPRQYVGRQRPCRQEDDDDDDPDDDDLSEDGWKLSEDMKSALERSAWLRRQMQDGGLRRLIQQIVDSKSPEAIRQVQKRFPRFQVFLDKVLVVAGVLERQEEEAEQQHHLQQQRQHKHQHSQRSSSNDEVEPLVEWLERDWSQDIAPPLLALKLPPAPKQRRMPSFPQVDVSSSSEKGENDDEFDDDDGSSGSDSDSGSDVDVESFQGNSRIEDATILSD